MSILTVGERKALRTYAENVNWFRANYGRIAARHSNRYIAVNDEAVVDSDADPKRLIERLRKRYGQRMSTFAIEFVSTDDTELIM